MRRSAFVLRIGDGDWDGDGRGCQQPGIVCLIWAIRGSSQPQYPESHLLVHEQRTAHVDGFDVAHHASLCDERNGTRHLCVSVRMAGLHRGGARPNFLIGKWGLRSLGTCLMRLGFGFRRFVMTSYFALPHVRASIQIRTLIHHGIHRMSHLHVRAGRGVNSRRPCTQDARGINRPQNR